MMVKKCPKPSKQRNEIIEITIDLIAEKSISLAGMREIAKKAGTYPSTIYYHFKNKEDLLFNTILFINEHINEYVSKIDIDLYDTNEAKFKALVRRAYDFLFTHPNYASTLRQYSIAAHLYLSDELRDELTRATAADYCFTRFLGNMKEESTTIRELGMTATLFCYMPIYDFALHTLFPKSTSEKQIDIFIDSMWKSVRN
jgi:AcrR family transcriptional regulator